MEKLKELDPQLQDLKAEQKKIYESLDYYKKLIGEKKEGISDAKAES
jgi:hypothetical protein